MVASAQTDTPTTTNETPVVETSTTGVTFPITELGNCTDKASCRAYCDEPSHMEACISFGKSRGLINDEEAERGKRFAAKLKVSSGPGGCKTPNECKAYCEDVSNLDVCVSFAKQNNINDKNTAESERIANYIKSGGTMPGNCTSKEDCTKYCSDFSHADECRAFAEKIGLSISQGKNPVPPGQFQKFSELAKKGETPGGCNTALSCKTYCSTTANREECISFGKEAGIITADKADKLQKLGRVGPGGCNTAESCEAYCNDQVNRDECFKFAGDNDLISKDNLKKAEDGLVRFRQGLSNASPEVVACLTSSLGENIITDIQSGSLTPGVDIGERAKICFEKFGKKLDVAEELRRVNPEVLSCVKEKLGDTFLNIQSGETALTADNADVIRVCAERMRFLINTEGASSRSSPSVGLRSTYNSAPPEVQACIKAKLGNIDSIAEENISEDVKAVFRGCYESFKPSSSDVRKDPSVIERRDIKTMPVPAQRYSPEIISCLKTVISPDEIVRIMNGEKADIDPGILAKCISASRSGATNTGIVPIAKPIRVVEPVLPTGIRPEVIACLKQNFQPEEVQKILAGGKTEESSAMISKCINYVQSTNLKPIINVEAVPIKTTVDPVKSEF